MLAYNQYKMRKLAEEQTAAPAKPAKKKAPGSLTPGQIAALMACGAAVVGIGLAVSNNTAPVLVPATCIPHTVSVMIPSWICHWTQRLTGDF